MVGELAVGGSVSVAVAFCVGVMCHVSHVLWQETGDMLHVTLYHMSSICCPASLAHCLFNYQIRGECNNFCSLQPIKSVWNDVQTFPQGKIVGWFKGRLFWLWHVTHDMWHATHDMWHMLCDLWHVTFDMLLGWTFSQNFSFLALTVCYLWYFEDLEEKADLLTELMTKVFGEQPQQHRVLKPNNENE